VVLVGSSASRETSQALLEEGDGLVADFSGQLSLEETAGIIAGARVFLGNDSGLTHLANLLGTPVVGLFGPTDPHISGPAQPPAVVLQKPAPCAPCSYKTCPYDHRCLNNISAGSIRSYLFLPGQIGFLRFTAPGNMIRFDDIIEKIQGKYSEKDLRLLQKAYIFAARAHKGQIRRSGEPYLSHPLEVTNILAEMNLDLATLVAGLLHDVLEDTEVSLAEIRENFGREAATLVEGVTKISRVEDSSPEETRAETIRKIILAMTDDLRVIFIKLADRWHNLKTLHYLSEDKQRRIAQETLEIYAPIANRLGMGRIRAELEDLSFRYVEPDEYFRMVALVEPELKKGEKELKKLKKVMDQLLKDNGIPAEIQVLIKRLYSVYSKMKKRE